jgi:hypothetical protein
MCAEGEASKRNESTFFPLIELKSSLSRPQKKATTVPSDLPPSRMRPRYLRSSIAKKPANGTLGQPYMKQLLCCSAIG